jgi:hypothetical protein
MRRCCLTTGPSRPASGSHAPFDWRLILRTVSQYVKFDLKFLQKYLVKKWSKLFIIQVDMSHFFYSC